MKSRDFETMVPEIIYPHAEDVVACPSIHNWPDDEFSRWVVSNREELKGLVCSSSSHSDIAFCAT